MLWTDLMKLQSTPASNAVVTVDGRPVREVRYDHVSERVELTLEEKDERPQPDITGAGTSL